MSGIHIDNDDSSRVNYTGNWVRGGTITEYGRSVSSSINVGDFFTVLFEGTAIAVYGTFDSTSQGVVTNYSIDGAPAVQVTSQYGFGDIQHQQFWVSDQFPASEHKLVVTMARVNFDRTPNEGTVWFDYFIVDPPPNATQPSGVASLQDTGSRKHAIGPIIGGAIGGLFFFLGVALLFMFYQRHRRSSGGWSNATRLGSVKPFFSSDRSIQNPQTTPDHGSNPDLSRNSPAPLQFHKSPAVQQPIPTTPPGLSVEPSSTVRPMYDQRGSNPSEEIPQRLLSIAILPVPQSSSELQPPTRHHADDSVRALNSRASNSPNTPSPEESPPIYSPN